MDFSAFHKSDKLRDDVMGQYALANLQEGDARSKLLSSAAAQMMPAIAQRMGKSVDETMDWIYAADGTRKVSDKELLHAIPKFLRFHLQNSTEPNARLAQYRVGVREPNQAFNDIFGADINLSQVKGSERNRPEELASRQKQNQLEAQASTRGIKQARTDKTARRRKKSQTVLTREEPAEGSILGGY